MNIHLSYEPTAVELTQASIIYLEKKPLVRIVFRIVNIFSIIVLALLVLKIMLTKTVTSDEGLAAMGAFSWLFGRSPLIRTLFLTRLKRSPLTRTMLRIDISLNGIAWSGTHVKNDGLQWNALRYILETPEGFILPYTPSQFLWLPFRGFTSTESIQEFRTFAQSRHIALEHP